MQQSTAPRSGFFAKAGRFLSGILMLEMLIYLLLGGIALLLGGIGWLAGLI
jgi:hypothetical protein